MIRLKAVGCLTFAGVGLRKLLASLAASALQAKLTEAQREAESLRQELRRSREELGRARETLSQARAEHVAVGLEVQRSREQLAETAGQLSEATCERAALEAAAAELREQAQELSDAVQADANDVKKYGGRSALDFYDAVFTIPKLEDLYIPEQGWPVRVSERSPFDFGGPVEGVRVIPVGHFNAGKTWLIAQLSGAELPRGVAVHTEGISVKAACADRLKIVLLDTVGSNSPMRCLPAGASDDRGGASKTAECVLQELRVQEDFIRQLCFEVGQVVLFVVGQMSHRDQTELLRLARAIRKDRVRKDIVVVHNLRDWSMKMLTEDCGADGLSYADRNKSLFSLSDASLDVTVGAETKRVVRHNGLFSAEGGSRDAAVKVSHYYLTNHRLPCSCNQFAIQDLRATITRSTGAARSLAEEFAAAATKIQARFASFNVREPEVMFDPSASRFRVRDALPEGAFRMKPRDLGAYFAVGSDDPAYSITMLKCQATVSTGRGAGRKVDKRERDAYHVQFELPGLCWESLEEIKQQFLPGRDAGALQQEPLEGQRGRQCTISFQATLANIPGGHYEQICNETKGEVEPATDPVKHEVTEVGSRPNFYEGARTVNVTLRTGIMDYDSSQDPMVSYADGVLGITLMKQGR